MRTSPKAYEAAQILHGLQGEISPSRLGLLVQALLAHVILRVGGIVHDIRDPGHPDILARLRGVLLKIEVEIATQKQGTRELDVKDIDTLWSTSDSERGYFCVLDFGPPIAWLCIDISSLRHRLYKPLRLSLLRSYADQEVSVDWTAEFSELMVKEKRNLRYLTFSQLREEACSGKYR